MDVNRQQAGLEPQCAGYRTRCRPRRGSDGLAVRRHPRTRRAGGDARRRARRPHRRHQRARIEDPGLRRRAHRARARGGLHGRAAPGGHRARADQGDGHRRGGREHTPRVRPGDGRGQLPERTRQRGGHRRHRRPRAGARRADRPGRDPHRAGGGAQLRRPADVRGRDEGRVRPRVPNESREGSPPPACRPMRAPTSGATCGRSSSATWA